MVKTPAAHSISPLDSKESKMNKVRIEAEGAKGRKDQDEGRRGRKGESLSDDELPEELGQEEEDAAKKKTRSQDVSEEKVRKAGQDVLNLKYANLG